jgi:multicomponent Na+:H+ antiporter subunit F
MYTAAAVAILVTMVLAITRAMLGPTVYDRILAVNMFGTKTVLIIAAIAFMSGRPDLINFIGVVAVLKFFEYGEFSRGGRGRP